MTTAERPLGLHLHVVAHGPSLRFALWFEHAAPPRAFAEFKGFERDVPFAHPFAVKHAAAPDWLPSSFERCECHVPLERLGTYLPVPLPGLIAAWDLGNFRVAGRATNRTTYRVPAWLVPPDLMLGPLRTLLHRWTARHGAGFVTPDAATVLDVLETMRARLAEGPLLPTRRPASGPLGAVAWVPPISYAELHRIDARLRGGHLPAAVAPAKPDVLFRTPPTWADAKVPRRLGHLLIEAFDGAARRGGAVPADVSETALRDAFEGGTADALHADHRSCLGPSSALFTAPAVPREHLHGRLQPSGDEGDGWELEAGLLGSAGAFLPVAAIAADRRLRDAAIEHEGAVWLHAAEVLYRDWSLGAEHAASLFTAPELLAGRVRVVDEAAQALLAQRRFQGDREACAHWLDAIGEYGTRAAVFTAFSVAPTHGTVARVRLHWDLADDAETSLHAARFVPRFELAVGDGTLDVADVEALLAASDAAFVRLHGRVVPRADLAAAVDLVRARQKVLRSLDAARGVSWSKAVELEDAWLAERTATLQETLFAKRWEAFLDGLRDGSGVPRRTPPASFHGTLRPYQLRGLSWLAFVVEKGFGGCLADDMGLGKTVQILALLALRREAGAPASLVVCPTAVVLNWAQESARFTPGLRVVVHQGAARASTPADVAAAVKGADLVVTSYALLRRDADLFEDVRWDLVIADEAHGLKNPEALQTRAVRALAATAKLCLTGTPVENRLRDLWSIFNVALPGLLGGPTRFARTFQSPIGSGDARSVQRLGRRVGPFLLRRTKRDPGIAADLPPKQEQDAWCDLTREQTALYRAMTDAVLEGIAGADGIARRAHILGALTRLKQICNHPESFERERPDQLLGRSGKLDRTLALLEELLDAEQRVLVFTQYLEMGRILQRAIDERFDVAVDFYHGGLTPAEREAVLRDFEAPDGPPVLVVSLRAGGSGLNLTAASAVIHYDRWWNPAVEDQATDRAHRIGQTRTVNVYKLATRGTLEERTVALLASKRDLAAKVLGGADESWITEMDDGALRAFLTLGDAAEEP